MRASVENLIRALHAQKPPRHIWQEPFDYNPSHYKRLCNLKGAAPRHYDLVDYAHDMCYATTLQPDLFRFLLPICLQVWRQDLLASGLANGHSEYGYGSFVEEFWAALANRPVLQDNLTAGEYEAVEAFMADSLLDCIDQEIASILRAGEPVPIIGFTLSALLPSSFPRLRSFGIVGGR